MIRSLVLAAALAAAAGPAFAQQGMPKRGDQWTYEGRDLDEPGKPHRVVFEVRSANAQEVVEAGQRDG